MIINKWKGEERKRNIDWRKCLTFFKKKKKKLATWIWNKYIIMNLSYEAVTSYRVDFLRISLKRLILLPEATDNAILQQNK